MFHLFCPSFQGSRNHILHWSLGCFRWHKCSLQSIFTVNYVDLGQIVVQGQCIVTKSASPTHRATRAFSWPPARHRTSARARERHLVLWASEGWRQLQKKERDKHQNVRANRLMAGLSLKEQKSNSFVMISNKAPVSGIKKSLFRYLSSSTTWMAKNPLSWRGSWCCHWGHTPGGKVELNPPFLWEWRAEWEARRALPAHPGLKFPALTELSTGRCNWCHHWAFWNHFLRRNLILGI